MNGNGHRDGALEYLVVVVDAAGRFRDAYGPYAFGAALGEADRRRRTLWEAGEHTADVRIARHHPVSIPLQRRRDTWGRADP